MDNLRNRVDVTVEFFDCITVLCSGLPNFERICKFASPRAIVLFLNTLGKMFDEVVRYFDIYRVQHNNATYIVSPSCAKIDYSCLHY